MIFYSGKAGEWLKLYEREKKQLIGPVLAVQKQKNRRSKATA